MKKTHLGIFILIVAVLGVALFAFQEEKKETKILFVGDMMFDRYIRKVGYTQGEDFVFSCKDSNGMVLSDFLKDSDLVVGNLEGPITENASVSMFTTPGGDGNFTFTFPTNTAKLLAKDNIKLVSLGNNHIGNFGMEGLDSTKKFLTEAEVGFFGGYGGDEAIYRIEINGNKISFISFNEFGIEPVESIVSKIKQEKSNKQTVIVYAHWGDEYVAPPQRIKNIAKLFADAGADFVIGSHPHVVLSSEKIENTTVYYSLGNFIFDQYWNDEVSTGLVLEFLIEGKKPTDWKIKEHKISIGRDGRTCLVE
jgi:poly-gamma-glutamate synthesis protein (capsule biosynthesis protein)